MKGSSIPSHGYTMKSVPLPPTTLVSLVPFTSIACLKGAVSRSSWACNQLHHMMRRFRLSMFVKWRWRWEDESTGQVMFQPQVMEKYWKSCLCGGFRCELFFPRVFPKVGTQRFGSSKVRTCLENLCRAQGRSSWACLPGRHFMGSCAIDLQYWNHHRISTASNQINGKCPR